MRCMCGYGCRCFKADKQGHFLPTMPLTQLGDPRCDAGWACAQRRPLRTLSHLLSLIDPIFVLLADDDTYINYKKLKNMLNSKPTHFMLKDLTSTDTPLVIGNYIAPRYGQLSPRGFLLGGAGYLLGRGALSRLIAQEAFVWPPLPSRTKRQTQSYMLSVLREALEADRISRQGGGEAAASGGDNCLQSCVYQPKPPDANTTAAAAAIRTNSKTAAGYVQLNVRLVDLCTALMAGEHTCHHRYNP